MSQHTRIGTEVAGYRLESVVGRGGMSVIYLAEQVRLGRKVALKLLAPELAEDERFRERFLRESRLASTFEHPNIIPIHDAGEEGGLLYIAMRYIAGPSLKELIKRQGPLSVGRMIYIVEQIASALDVAHAHALVHRDVKPANILIEESSDHAFLSDFGVAKQTTARGMTSTGLFLGTVEYSSPEQIEGRPVDGRTDVYGLGCVLVEGLTAAPPFEQETEVALIHAHLSAPPPMVTARRPDLPLGLNGVVARALAKSPEERYQSAGELAVALREAALRSSTAARATQPGAPVEQTVVPPAPLPEPSWAAAPLAPTPVPATQEVAATPVEPAERRRGPRRTTVIALAIAGALLIGALSAGGAVLLTRGGSNDGSASPATTRAGGGAAAAGAMHETTTNGSSEGAMQESTGAHMAMEGTAKGPPTKRFATFVAGETSWRCSSAAPQHGASATMVCATKVPDRLAISIFGTRRALASAYGKVLRSQGGIPRNSGSCSATSWRGEVEWFHGEGEPGGRAFCRLDTRRGVTHLVWTSNVGVPTLYVARYPSLDHRNLYFWWANFRHDVF